MIGLGSFGMIVSVTAEPLNIVKSPTRLIAPARMTSARSVTGRQQNGCAPVRACARPAVDALIVVSDRKETDTEVRIIETPASDGGEISPSN
jgi:hypothetical protein